MNLKDVVHGVENVAHSAQNGDFGGVIQKQIAPISSKVEEIEKKIDTLIALMQKIDEDLKAIQPLYNMLMKLPFLRK